MAEAIESAWQAGDAVLPLPPDENAARRLLDRTRPHLLRGAGGDRPLPSASPLDDDVVLVVGTSGTTTRPRAVELTAAALEASTRAGLQRIGAQPGDRWLACLPLHHVAGVLVLERARTLGTEPIVHASFDPDEVARSPATHVSLVPTMLVRLLDRRLELGARRVLLGGAPASAQLLQRAALAGVAVTVTYGMTETSGGCVYDGLPLDGVNVEIVEPDEAGVGRVAISGQVVASGYRLGRRFDGAFMSQDLGRWNDDGRLEVVGRADDVILTGGVNVPAAGVAAVLAEHPAVAEVTVHGVADDVWGERVVAVVVPNDPARPPTLEELRVHVRRQLPAEAAPRELAVVDELPRTTLGKIRRPQPPETDPPT